METNHPLLAHDLVALKPSDTISAAIHIMQDCGVQVLPVIDHKQLIGCIRLADIEEENQDNKVVDYLSSKPMIQAQNDLHPLTLYHYLSSHATDDMLVIVNKQKEFVGLVRSKTVMQALDSAFFAQPGAIISLSIDSYDYTVSEISRLIESNDAKLLYLNVQPDALSQGKLVVTLKLNITHVNKILSAFERFNYQVIAVYEAEPTADDVESKYKYLIHYLHT